MTNYNAASKTYDNTRDSDDVIIEMMEKRNVFGKDKNILDYGCGTGNYLRKISRRYEGNFYGLEPSEGMREKARAKNPGLTIIEGNEKHIPYDDNFFDFIYMTDVIHHVPDRDALFLSLFQKTRSGGRLCVMTQSWAQIGARWYNRFFPSLEANQKTRYPDIPEIQRRAVVAGFHCLETGIKPQPDTRIVDAHFIKMVEEKNYSMFRDLGEDEFARGLKNLKEHAGMEIPSKNAGESLVWFQKL